VDERKVSNRTIRSSGVLPLAIDRSVNDLCYYQAEISFMVNGVDEWRYTSYCCIDTYFGSEPRYKEYLKPPVLIEPAVGGSKELQYTLWNPRVYFLCVLSNRLEQAVSEAQSLVNCFEARMNSYVG
jgi:hypothetical protein